MDVITPTTILTTSQSIALITLSSGNQGMVVYAMSTGDVLTNALLGILVILTGIGIWRR
jgi:hypothetical protein